MAGNPSLKDSNGVVTPATNAGGPLQLNEQPGAPSTVADAVKVYAKDAGGITELFALNDSGDEIQLTADGGIATGYRIRWRNDVPGDLFDATQVATTITTPVKAVISNGAFALSGTYTINYASSPYPTGSVALVNGDRVLRASTTNPINNGIWVVGAGPWTRATDANTWPEIQDGIVEWPISTLGGPPSYVIRWMLWNPTNTTVTPGTDPQEWVVVFVGTFPTGDDPVEVVSTSNLTLAGAQTVDGVGLNPGDRILVNGQLNAVNNGVYDVQDPGAWTRSPDATEGLQILSRVILVDQGTFAGRGFTLRSSTTTGIQVGVDPQNWELVGQAGSEDFGPVRVVTDCGDAVMFRSGFPGIGNGWPFVNLPPITAANATRKVAFRNLATVIKGTLGLGLVVLQPSGSDFVSGGNPGEYLAVLMQGSTNFSLESDGLSQWNVVDAGGIVIYLPGGTLSGQPLLPGPEFNSLLLRDTP
jgi:hypothetical protein